MSQAYLFGKGQTLKVFSLFCLLMVFDFTDRMIIAALLPAIKAEWQLSDAQSGLLSSVLFFGMVVFALPASVAIDRWSRTKTASLMGIFWSLASLSGAFAQSFAQLTVTRALVGIGEAGYAPAAYAWISAAFPKSRRQLALGVFSACQAVGMAFGVALGGYIGTHYGWRSALGIMALPGVVIAYFLYRGDDYKTFERVVHSAAGVTRFSFPNLLAILKTPSLLLAYFISAMTTLQWVPVFYFLPTFLSRVHAIPTQTASYMASGLMLLAIFGVPLGGWIMDRFNERPLLKLDYALSVTATATTIYAITFSSISDPYWQYGLIVLAALINSTSGTAVLNMTQELVHPSLRALSGTYLIIVLHLLGSTPGPYLTGLISDHYDLGFALLVVVVGSGSLALVGLLVARRFYLNDLAGIGSLVLSRA